MGNMTSYGNVAYTWDGKQLVDICILPTDVHISYSYNEDGLRVGKRVSWSSLGVERNTEYYYNGSVLIGMKTGDTVQRFSYDAQGKVVSVNYNGTEYYYVRNAKGDIVKLIDGSGNTVVEYTYDSWGKILAVTGSLATTLGENQPFRYRGYVYDTETGWYYLQSRYYNPETCRFISSDVLLSTGQGVLGHNAYAYCLNNPLILEDQGGAAAHFNNTVAVCDGGCDNSPRYPKSWDELNAGLAYYGITSEPKGDSFFKKIMNKIKGVFTSDPKDVIDRANSGKWFTVYKGALVKHTDFLNVFPSSCCLGPLITLKKDSYNETDLNHEYGHFVQFKKLGIRYYRKIGIPSLIGYEISKNNPNYNYYSQPWERTADMYGGIDRGDYLPYSDLISLIYLSMPL